MRRWIGSGLRALPLFLIAAAIYTLEYFGRMRMGMMRYLVFMKREFESGFFQPMTVCGLTLLAALLALLILFKMAKASVRARAVWRYWLLNTLILLCWLIVPVFKTLKSYYFGLSAWLLLGAVTGLISIYRLRKIDKASHS